MTAALVLAVEDLNQPPAPLIALAIVLIPLGIIAGLDLYFAWRDGDRYRGGFVWARNQSDTEVVADGPESS